MLFSFRKCSQPPSSFPYWAFSTQGPLNNTNNSANNLSTMLRGSTAHRASTTLKDTTRRGITKGSTSPPRLGTPRVVGSTAIKARIPQGRPSRDSSHSSHNSLSIEDSMISRLIMDSLLTIGRQYIYFITLIYKHGIKRKKVFFLHFV